MYLFVDNLNMSTQKILKTLFLKAWEFSKTEHTRIYKYHLQLFQRK